MAAKKEAKFLLNTADILRHKQNRSLFAIVTDIHGDSIHYVAADYNQKTGHYLPTEHASLQIESLGQIEAVWQLHKIGHITVEKERAAAARAAERKAVKEKASS